jgi:ribonuclease VapC
MAAAGIELAPIDADQAHIARQAFRQYGKGRHPAALNFGDCFSYALAKVSGFPLLFKGDVAYAGKPVPACSCGRSQKM